MCCPTMPFSTCGCVVSVCILLCCFDNTRCAVENQFVKKYSPALNGSMVWKIHCVSIFSGVHWSKLMWACSLDVVGGTLEHPSSLSTACGPIDFPDMEISAGLQDQGVLYATHCLLLCNVLGMCRSYCCTLDINISHCWMLSIHIGLFVCL